MNYVDRWVAKLFGLSDSASAQRATPISAPEVGRELFVIEKARLVHVLTASRADGGIDGRKVSRVSFDDKGLVLHFAGDEKGGKP